MSNDRDRPYRGLFGLPPPEPSSTDNFFNHLLKALEASRTPPPPTGVGLVTLFAPLSPQPQPNALGGIFGLQPPALAKPLPKAPQVRRRVFFSFHFEEDIRRSCLVRNSYRIRPGRKLPTANFHDRSLWETSKREGEESLKRLIREGMVGSSVTCVLAGTYTWQRTWVRYEIARSLVCGNGLFTVYIHNVKDPRNGMSTHGYDPLDFMGLELRPDGRGNICELVGEQWRLFDKHKAPVPWPRWLEKPTVGHVRRLSHGARAYDYHFDDGYNDLAEWAQLAAREAGRS
jgi:hypothetical protein